MNNFIFYSPTEFVFGRDTEAQTGALVQKYGARKVMIVYGGGSVIRSGLLARVEKSLQEVGIPYCMLGGVQPNPIDTKVYEGIDLCRKESVDMMLAEAKMCVSFIICLFTIIWFPDSRKLLSTAEGNLSCYRI